jgi:hypothetical protein
VARVSQTREHNRGVNGSMLSSRLLDHVFVSRVSQTREHNRGVKCIMLSSRLLDHVCVSRVSQTRENKRGAFSFPLITHHNGVLTRDTNTSSNGRVESMLPITPRLLSLV